MTELYVGNPHCIELESLASCADPDTTVEDATVEVTVTDSDGVEVGGVTWPIAMSYFAADQVYRGTIPADASFQLGAKYVVTVVAYNLLSDVIGQWQTRCTAVKRGAN